MNYRSYSHGGSNRIVVGITSRSSDQDLEWLMDFIRRTFRDYVSDVKFLPISNYNRIDWERSVRTCSVGILYHTKRQGRINITDVEGSLYDDELQMLSKTLGRSNVLVVLDDLENCLDSEKQRILDTQPRLQRFSSGLVLFPEEGKYEEAMKKKEEFIKLLGIKLSARDLQPSTTRSKDSSSSSLFGALSWFSRDKIGKTISDHIPKLPLIDMPSVLTQPRLKISIFSRSAESNYGWLVEELKTTYMSRPVDVRSVYISNNHSPFYSELSNCSFAILYHTKKQGRINLTDVTDNLYDEELSDLFKTLGKENVIVVIDDLENADSFERDRILRSQPSIGRLARGLFLFNEKKKNRENLEEIHKILKKKIPRIEAPSNGFRPDIAPINYPSSSTHPGIPDPALSKDSSVEKEPTSSGSQRRPDRSTAHDATQEGANYSGGPEAKRRNLDLIGPTPRSSQASAEMESAIQNANTYFSSSFEANTVVNMKWQEYKQVHEEESREMAERIQRLHRENEQLQSKNDDLKCENSNLKCENSDLKCENSDLVLKMREEKQLLEAYNTTIQEKERKMEDEMKELKRKLSEKEKLLIEEIQARHEAERNMEKFHQDLREKDKTMEEHEDTIRKIEEKIQQLQTDNHVTETNPRQEKAGHESQRYKVRSPIPEQEADHTSCNQDMMKYERKEEASPRDGTQWKTTTLYDPEQKPSETQSLREAEEQIQELRRTIREKEEEIQKMKTQREDNEILINDILMYLRGGKNMKS